ncbi:MAG: FAD-dependent oxidoreductase [Rhodocyclaceae bacterium]|nr:FAD-dependent oxidoreductase [Rhodocyclaceae bacterium]MBX3666868.1 FAD-dependent oxidoreductase [Rhodocyclaceae bacterium]
MQKSQPFPNFMQMPTRVPRKVWHALRALSVTFTLGVGALLIVNPKQGLTLFWGVLVPSLPLVFFIVPGLWRNLCPLSTMNQIPRLFGFTRGLTLTGWMREYAYVIGITVLFLAVPARHLIFNSNGPAAAGVVFGALALAFVGGFVFKGKSGWCSSFCPLLPVQRLYGQTPFVVVPNSHCQPCVGCAKNCYDFNPLAAYLADQYDDDVHYRGYRRFFAGAFPGLIVAYFTTQPGQEDWLHLYGRFAVSMAVSIGSFTLFDTFLKTPRSRLTAIYAIVALNLFYWWIMPRLVMTVGALAGLTPSELVAPALQGALVIVSLHWLYRSFRHDRIFLKAALAPQQVGLSASAKRVIAGQDAGGGPEVSFEPGGVRVIVARGRTLLEIAEANSVPIEPGCRMGMCGADPVHVTENMENLSPMSDEERATLSRLGLGDNARLACCARVQGNVCVSLKAAPASDKPAVAPQPALAVDKSIRSVVIIGNGIAGITAADHLRRNHPDCEIHVLAREAHHLYNRMAITRLIYGRSAMEGLYLQPDKWYEERRITVWLNTRAESIDVAARRITLGTRETLDYDRLIITAGSRSLVPPIQNFGLPGSFVLRTAEDAMEVRAYAQQHRCRTAMVGGGGLLGLEAAYALHKLGLQVAVLERSERLLRRQLDARAAELLTGYLVGMGLQIVAEAEADAVEGDGRVQSVMLKDGRRIRVDLFVSAAGIDPCVEVARAAGITTGKGITVDEQMRTNVPGIYAAGDVAEYKGNLYGLWPAAVTQAEIAAVNALGGERTYSGTVASTILKVVGVDVASVGRFESGKEGDETFVHEDLDNHRYRKLICNGGRAVGGILVGHPQENAALAAMVKENRDLAGQVEALRANDWSLLSA